MDISVFGIGYVGAVSAACLASDGHQVIAVDVNPLKVEMLNAGRSPVVETGLEEKIRQGIDSGRLRATVDGGAAIAASEISFVCVGTPSQANGSLDLGHVLRVCEDIGAALRGKTEFHVVVMRSTMLPGSMLGAVIPALEQASGKVAGQDFGVALYPEFLREGSAIADYYGASTIVFGVSEPRTEAALSAVCNGLHGRVHITSITTAEAVKYANNAWHAAKIVFANEIGAFASRQGIDSHEVMRILCTDDRLNISPVYLRPGFAYGGSCLPKDLRALLYKARSTDVALPMLEALAVSNAHQIQRAFDLVAATGKRRVALIGLSFKSGTDDLRESPAVELAKKLFGEGYDLKIFDHNVDHAKLVGSNLAFIKGTIPHLADLLSGDLEAVVAYGDVIVITHGDLGGASFPSLAPDKVVIDLVRLAAAVESGARYVGLCW